MNLVFASLMLLRVDNVSPHGYGAPEEELYARFTADVVPQRVELIIDGDDHARSIDITRFRDQWVARFRARPELEPGGHSARLVAASQSSNQVMMKWRWPHERPPPETFWGRLVDWAKMWFE